MCHKMWGHGSVGQLTEFMMCPQPDPDSPTRDPKWSVVDAEAAGLSVVDLREFRGRMEFYDIAAVVMFLRKVIRIVPQFTVDSYRDRLAALHDRIESEGPFLATSVRFLLEARKPAAGDCPRRRATGAPARGGTPRRADRRLPEIWLFAYLRDGRHTMLRWPGPSATAPPRSRSGVWCC
jgi:hypothetical protein